MKKSLFSGTMIIFFIMLSGEINGQCDYRMSREHANYFASGAGYNGVGMLPVLGVGTYKKMMTKELRNYYEKNLPVCSYCLKESVLASWDNDLAICNAANYYHNLFMADHNKSMQIMDNEILRLKRKN